MSDSNEAPPSPSSTGPRLRHRLFTSDQITAAFTVVLALATLALVGTAIVQHFDTLDAVEATKRLALANETAAAETRRTASADFVMKIDAVLNQTRFEKIGNDVQSHNSKYRLPKYPNPSDADVDDYVGVFDDVGYFVTHNLIEPNIAYEHFSNEVEKTWCNVTVQETIRDERATDKSKTAQSDPQYIDFERLAKDYLETDGLSCNDLDNPVASTSKKQRTRKTH